jgi:hypothetical protein
LIGENVRRNRPEAGLHRAEADPNLITDCIFYVILHYAGSTPMSSGFLAGCRAETRALKYPLTSDTAFLILTSPKRKFCLASVSIIISTTLTAGREFPGLSAWRSGMRRLT